jgi:hypothetical protein
VRPQRIVRRAGPAHHPAADDVGEDGEHDHSKGLAANMRDGIERDLSAVECGEVAPDLRGQGVRRFMTGGGEKERDVPGDAEDQGIGIGEVDGQGGR